MQKNLRYFMREDTKEEKVVTIPGIDSIRDENGDIIPFEVRLLPQRKIQDITDNYRLRKLLLNNRGEPFVVDGEAVFQSEYDSARAGRHVLCETLLYPDLKNPELMSFYGCFDITEMPLHVFAKKGELAQVMKNVSLAYNTGSQSIIKEAQDAKN